MTVHHTDPEDLARFLRGEMSSEDNRRMVRQLTLAHRGGHDERVNSWQPWRTGASPSALVRQEQLEERALDLVCQREDVPRLGERLAAVAPSGRRAAIRAERAYHSWALCEWLIDRCHEFAYDERAEAEEMAELAIAIADELDANRYSTGLINDLKARAWAAAAEVLRIASDLRSAEEAYAIAEKFAGDGTGDALEEAWVLELEATLRRDQQQMAEAHRLLDEVAAIYRQYCDFHLVGRAFVQKGRVYGTASELEAAIHWLRKGLALIDPDRDPRLELLARHSLVLCLHEAGRNDEAWFMLKASRREFAAKGGVLLNLRVRWLEGKIQHALGRLGPAEAAYMEARQGFIRQEVGFDAAMVCLDLAGLYAVEGRAVEMRRVAEEMLPIFQARDLHREAIAALIVFQQSVLLENVNLSLLEEIGAYLRRARRDHRLRFEHAV